MSDRIQFYMDENVPRAVTEALRQKGVDVYTAQDADMLDTTDDQHLAFAASQRRVVFTQNVDCLRWHENGMWHKGIVYASPKADIDTIVRRLLLIYDFLSADDMIAHVEFI
jgi:hypothetical protein